MAQDYNNTLNLPKTDFSMRASLPQKEPDAVKNWDATRLYYKIIEKNQGKPNYILHDGPPYANADIHLGTALNKVLKDIVVRSHNMMGYKSAYVPGWDTHGLPIELRAMEKIKDKTNIDPIELRKICKEYALHFMGVQANSFKRLGVLGDFDDPYLTLKPAFEAKQIEVFGEMAKKGFIYKGLKPVYWCPSCVTALAEAEIEYADDTCYSIYVKFFLKDDKGVLTNMGADLSKTSVVIWTTTTWTLPANVAICLGGDFDYALVKANGEYMVMATELVKDVMSKAGIGEYEIVGQCKGSDLELATCQHPFIDRESLIILGDHVTLDSGTGCVHTAPGHGVEDFEVCTKHYPQLPVVVPVDNHGKLTELAGRFAGLTTDESGKVISDYLKEHGNLLAVDKLVHQYPHCWRCKKPVLFRATEQWFCSVEKFRDEAINAVRSVKWIPGWGEDRMAGMITDRSDWCISRQRLWGVPIPMFYCKSCGRYHIDDSTIKAVSELFKAEGSDAWYIKSAKEILPEGTTCPACGGTEFTKEMDIMDVWFDSGVTHAAVLEQREELDWPCDLYLEGADQYRGWFQSSLLTSVACRGKAPYKAVCTHGWVVDGEGKKMSKSLGNGILASEIVEEYGADMLRLWVASSDYHTDIRLSRDILKQLSEVYRKIRNTARYILGNLEGFDPNTNMVADDQLEELDRWALMQSNELVAKAHEAYNSFDFYVLYHAMHNFCTVDMSNFYLDIIKDRLYVEAPDSVARRAAQTTIYRILRDLTLILAPLLPFTAEEIWAYMPKSNQLDSESVMFNQLPAIDHSLLDQAFAAKWDQIHAIRDEVNKVLETARTAKKIGKSLEAKITLYADGELLKFLQANESQLATIFIVSKVEVKQTDGSGEKAGGVDGLSIAFEKASGGKCERCWVYSDTVGTIEKHPTLCSRCAAIVDSLSS